MRERSRDKKCCLLTVRVGRHSHKSYYCCTKTWPILPPSPLNTCRPASPPGQATATVALSVEQKYVRVQQRKSNGDRVVARAQFGGSFFKCRVYVPLTSGDPLRACTQKCFDA